ncbi:MAG TPA: superoxide dismutase family protein [Tepidisphaeraceae bacterium]|nr:superoxide dismutase family protein [Tepidisphaeraceae bacterium]
MKRISVLCLSGIVAAAAVCASYAVAGVAHSPMPLAEQADNAMQAVAHVHGAGANKAKITGTVTFMQTSDGMKVVADIEGLSPGKHGFHIHEKPDLSAPDLSSAGGHFNPHKHKHGGPHSASHHAGDLGNLTADAKGHAHLDATFKGLSIEGTDGVVGHSVIIHQDDDDLKTDPAGNAGKRIAGGVIKADKQ